MTSYCITSIDKNPNNVIFHCETNDLKSDKSEMVIATELISFGKSIKAKEFADENVDAGSDESSNNTVAESSNSENVFNKLKA
eukprot:gene14971-6125_t